MRYKSFQIQNFKGIKDTTVHLQGVGPAGVFAFVGLNESGKTTLLEAIHSFSPDEATSELLGGSEKTGVPFEARVPRHLISTFTGDVSVTATVSLTDDDKEGLVRYVKEYDKLNLNKDALPSDLVIERRQRFERGNFKQDELRLLTPIKIKSPNQRHWRAPDPEELKELCISVYYNTPDIAYFPTFVFDFPNKIFLTDRGSAVDLFYRRVFQDILDYDGHGHRIEQDIVDRIRGKALIVPWALFFPLWGQRDDRDKIQHVMDRAGAAVTRLVFGRWNKIFGEDTRGKEVVIPFEIEEGEIEDAATGAKKKTSEHDISIKFQIRDGTRRFDVNDRSLGFRWFFAFMLSPNFVSLDQGRDPCCFSSMNRRQTSTLLRKRS